MASDQEEQSLILKHNNPINGLISIEINNLSTYWTDDADDAFYDHIFTLSYTFHEHETKEWEVIQFGDTYITALDTFQLKVPLRLLSYVLQYTLQYQSRQHKEESDSSITLFDVKSKQYMVQIPSMLIESSYNIGDPVLYNVEGCGFVRHGVILEIMHNDTMKIRKLYSEPEQESKTLTMHSSEVSRTTKDARFVVDITDRNLMECDLILRSNDDNIHNIYYELCESLINDNVLFLIEDEIYHCNYMVNFLAICICECLYSPDFSYRFECIFCDNFLFYKNQWQFAVKEYCQQIRNDIKMTEIQKARNCMGYSCDICRVELSWYEFTYHCYGEPRHDFCVSCMHSVLIQQNEMETYLSDILDGMCTDDCIREIVKFCTGNVQRF